MPPTPVLSICINLNMELYRGLPENKLAIFLLEVPERPFCEILLNTPTYEFPALRDAERIALQYLYYKFVICLYNYIYIYVYTYMWL